MGCFNTVIFECAHCGKETSEQTKNGTCSSKEDHIAQAEVEDVIGVSGYPITCEHCGESSVIENEITVKTKVRKFIQDET